MHNTMKKEKEEAEKEASARKMNTINEDSKSGSSDSENDNRDPPRMTSVASSGHYRKRKEQKSATKLENQDSIFGNTGTYSMSNTSPKDFGNG